MSVWEETYLAPERGTPTAPATRVAGVEHDGTGKGGLDLSFFANLGVTLGSIADSLQRDHDRRDRSGRAPQDYQPTVAGLVNSSGFLVLDMGSVPEGRVWQVRRIVIGGDKATATPTGAAWAFAQGAPVNTAVLPTINVVDSWPTFTKGAAGSTYGTHQLFLTSPEHLWIVITGGSTGVQWVASARIEDFDAESYYSAAAANVE